MKREPLPTRHERKIEDWKKRCAIRGRLAAEIAVYKRQHPELGTLPLVIK